MRTQFYDPFGMRMQGFRAGVQDEMQVQDQTRRADQFDWERANMRPIQLQAAQREEAFMGATDPWRRNMVQGQDYDAEIGRRLNYGLRSGNTAPAMSYDFNQFVPNAGYYQPEVSFMRNEQDGSMGWNLPGGGFAPFQQNPQNYLDYAAMQDQMLTRNREFSTQLDYNTWNAMMQEEQNRRYYASLDAARAAATPATAAGLADWNGGFPNPGAPFGIPAYNATPQQ